MKRQVSPAAAVLIVVLTFGAVMGYYWKGLLGQKEKGKPGPMMGGGAMPPPPLRGLPGVTVTTVAGPEFRTWQACDAGCIDAKGVAARFDGPSAVAVGPDGRVYLTDARNHRIRAVSADGTVTTLAGSGPQASVMGAFADGPAGAARFWDPSGIAVAPDGSVYIADTGNHRIRVLRKGVVTTLAGGETPQDRFGLPDGAFADGPGTTARFRYPTGIALASSGALLVADTGNRRLRRVAPDGLTTTIADLSKAGAQSPCGVAALPDGTALVTDPATAAVYRVTAAGQVSPLPGTDATAPIWKQPTGIAVGPDGTVYLADAGSHALLTLLPGQAPSLLAGVVLLPKPNAAYANGTGDNSAFAAPCGVAVGAGGELYVSDFGNNCVRKLAL